MYVDEQSCPVLHKRIRLVCKVLSLRIVRHVQNSKFSLPLNSGAQRYSRKCHLVLLRKEAILVEFGSKYRQISIQRKFQNFV